ncbi:MAG: alpha/beta fold hydrolase [Bryobacterales bacterium]|nr:alpha/beta fold hydrolase [Bryobacterales bacterium]
MRYDIAGPRRAIRAVRFAAGAPTRRVLYVHGYGEHKEMLNYRFLGDALGAGGVETHGFDLPGHGDERELPRDWTPMREDLQAVYEHVRPDAVIGLSLGSIVVLDWAIHHRIATPLVTIGAPLGKVGVSPFILLLGKVLSLIAPQANLSPKLGVRDVSRDRALVDRYLADPLFHQRATGKAFEVFFETVRGVRRNASSIEAPLLMLHGDADTLARPHPHFLERTSSPRRERIHYPGAKHNLFLETNRAEVFADILRFVHA